MKFNDMSNLHACLRRYGQALLACLLWLSFTCYAVGVVEFDSPEELERYQRLAFELRCPKCQNQNLIDSNSQISIDLRNELVRLIKQGKNDNEIKEHMVSLYGDFILYNPPLQRNTLILWGAPGLMILIGLFIFGFIIFNRSRMNEEEENLSSSEDSISSKEDA